MRKLLASLRNKIKSLCLRLFNIDEKIIEEGDTHATCLRSVSRQLKRVAAEKANCSRKLGGAVILYNELILFVSLNCFNHCQKSWTFRARD